MKKVLKMQDLDCANCAAKMETAVAKLEGVDRCSISFMTQKMTLEVDESRLEAIIREAQRVCKKIEPSCKILA